MANTKVSGRVSRIKKKLQVGFEELNRAIESETKNILDPQAAKNREGELRDMFFTARKKTKGGVSNFLIGLLGDDVGQSIANIIAKEDPSKIKSAQQFFKKYHKSEKSSISRIQKAQIAKLIGKQQKISSGTNRVQLKEGFYYDPSIGARGGIRNVRTGRLASKEEASAKRKETTDRLTKAIGADEEPLVLLRERFDVLVKTVGKDSTGKTIHEKLDDLINQVESGNSGFGLGNLFGLPGRRTPKPVPRKTKTKAGPVRKFFGGQQGRDAKGRFTKGGGFGAGKLLAGGLGAAAVGYLGYKAVDMFRDKELISYDPEALKQEAIAAREAGDTEYTEALKNQISAQKEDVKLQAGAQVASVAGAGVGAYGGVKVAQKIGATAPVKKAAAVVKNKTWDLFLKFLKKRSPKLANIVVKRLATAGALATVPIAGWVGAIISLGFAVSTAYDLYQLWKEFSALSDAEKETAASGKPKESAKPQTVAGAAAAGVAMAEAAAAKSSGSGAATTPSPTGPAAAIQAAKEPAMAAGGGGASTGGGAVAAAPSKGPERRLGPAAVKRGKVDPGAAKNAVLAAAGKYGITGPHLAQFMAQLDHESGGFRTVEENLRYSAKRLMEIFPKYYKDPAIAAQEEYSPIAIANRVYANRMGNGPPESGDGYKYRGRGLIQLTGKDNYKRFGQLAGVDLVSNPDMAGKLGTAADIAAAFYKKNVVDRGIAGEDTAKVTKAINGGSIGLSHRESLFASYMKDPNALKAGSEVKPSAVGAEPEPSMVAKGQDMQIGGGGGGIPSSVMGTGEVGVELSASTQEALAAVEAPTSYFDKEKQLQQSKFGKLTDLVGAFRPDIAQKMKGAESLFNILKPVQSSLGKTAIAESGILAKNTIEMQTTPPPIIVNNASAANPQPITPPKQNMPKASARTTDNSFNRALAKDFSHPTAFTSVAPI